jgi:hypothetical protein
MARLKGSVLSVVSETEQLAGLRGKRTFFMQVTNRREAQYGGSRAAAFSTKRRQFAEVRGGAGRV